MAILSVGLFYATPLQAFSRNTFWAPNQQRSLRLDASATELPEGIVKKVSKPGMGSAVNLGDIATVKYRCYLPSDQSAPPFAKADRQKMVR